MHFSAIFVFLFYVSEMWHTDETELVKDSINL